MILNKAELASLLNGEYLNAAPATLSLDEIRETFSAPRWAQYPAIRLCTRRLDAPCPVQDGPYDDVIRLAALYLAAELSDNPEALRWLNQLTARAFPDAAKQRDAEAVREFGKRANTVYSINSGEFVIYYTWEDDGEGDGKHVNPCSVKVRGGDLELLPSFEAMDAEALLTCEIEYQLKKK